MPQRKRPTKPSRLDRIEAAIEKLTIQQSQAAEDTAEFKRVVRGAFEVQQQQITELRQSIARLDKYMEAYLTRNPQ